MYEAFFNLKQKPFELLPNPDFLFMSSSHKRALSYLDYGIRERAGFILLTGEVGSGKTTIIRNLIRKNLDNVILSKVFNTRIDSGQLLAMINDDFGLPVQNKDKITMLRDLNAFLIEQFVKGNQAVLIIDEAQNLDHEMLEEIRMLSNLETDNAKLLQIILVGQPELRKTLASSSLIQLRQRISINCHIQPLSPNETEQYILHRLERAGDRDAVRFSQETVNIIYTYSRGIPRLINIICDFILLAAYVEEKTAIDTPLVQDIIGDLDFEYHFWGSESLDGHIMKEPAGDAAGLSPRSEQLFTAMIGELHRRLDAVGKESEQIGRRLAEEMGARLTELEQTVRTQQEETGRLIRKIHAGERYAGEGTQLGGLAVAEAAPPAMGTIFSRMFRF